MLNFTPKTEEELNLMNLLPAGVYDFTVINNTGLFKKKFTDSATVEVITKTNNDWRLEILSRCNVTLEVRDPITNALLFSQLGIPPFTFILSDLKSYKVLTKLTSK